MRRAPDWREFARYPVVTAVIAFATASSLAWWTDHDVSFLMPDAHIRRFELWRLVTCVLPHVNAFHLIFNVYWTWTFGTLVEDVYGSGRTAAIFLLLALVPSAAEFALFKGGVGLSGIGYGLFGLCWALRNRRWRFSDAVDDRTAGLFVVWFLICIVTTVQGLMPVANVAHGVGALVGLGLGAAIVRSGPARVGVALAIGVFAVASLAGATVVRPLVNLSSERGRVEAQLGYEALMAHRDAEAVRWLEEATQLDASQSGSFTNLGIAYLRRGEPEKAAAAFDRAERMKPGRTPSRDPGR